MKAQDLMIEWRRIALFCGGEARSTVYRDVYSLRMRNALPLLDDVLTLIDVAEFPESFLVALLTATAVAACQLRHRADFYRRVRSRVESTHGSRRASRLLIGLSCPEGDEGDAGE